MRPAAAPRTAASLSQRARRADQRGRGRGAPEGNAAVRRRGRKKEASASDEDEHVAGGRRGRLLERESGAEEAVVAGGARSDGGAPEEQNGARGGGLEGGGADASGDGREGEAGGGAGPRPPQSERPSSSSPGSQASGTELQTTTFAALGLDKWLVDALAAMSIRRPTEIQCACILPTVQGEEDFWRWNVSLDSTCNTNRPFCGADRWNDGGSGGCRGLCAEPVCLSRFTPGRDVIGNAKTGSGKTAAFALPILQKLSEDPYGIFALVLTPTRYACISGVTALSWPLRLTIAGLALSSAGNSLFKSTSSLRYLERP
ncbi:MAG: hypothetical protein BJ554DRAFT_1191 [Olpidium bornovanus]|uniref:Uncharacterized protein n=1 Tax=Olpidium bornovanus TaxID=278681 RepID=A0A8H7ZS93_9FUNG|nr:MAG: hypothetical protein BJ554DRAFT_1191 [Olpidium bornovanus]